MAWTSVAVLGIVVEDGAMVVLVGVLMGVSVGTSVDDWVAGGGFVGVLIATGIAVGEGANVDVAVRATARLWPEFVQPNKVDPSKPRRAR